MNSPALQTAPASASFDERLAILAEELELSVKWQRPCILMVVYSSEYVRADVEAALQNCLIDLGQKCVHLSVKDRDPNDVVPFFKEFKDPGSSVFVIDGFRWGKGEDGRVYSTIGVQREFFLERKVRTIFWLTQNEVVKLAHAAPDFWAHRQRVIEFVESPSAAQMLRQALDSAWQGTGEYAGEYEDTDAKISLREAMLTELPRGEEAVSIRGNLMLTLGVLNWRKGDFEKADEQLSEALRIATRLQDNWFEAECFNAMALIKSSTNRVDEAIDAYKQAIELAPDQIFVWNNLGNLCAKIGRNDEAMVAFRKALEGNPRDPIAWNGLGSLHFRLGYVDDAIAAYRKSIQYTPVFAQPWCGLGDVYASTGRSDEALKCYHKAIDLNKLYVEPWIRLGVLFTKQERYREAVRAYQRALGIDPKNGQAWNDLGSVHMKMDAFGEAAEAFSKALELDRGNGWAYSNLAFANMAQGRYKESVSLLVRSIDLLEKDADKATAWNRLASVYRTLNDYDNAVSALQMADELTKGKSQAKVEVEAPQPATSDAKAAPAIESQTIMNAATAAVTPAGAAKPEEAPVEATVEVKAEEVAPRKPTDDAPAWIFAAETEQVKVSARGRKAGKAGSEAAVTQTAKSAVPQNENKAPEAEQPTKQPPASADAMQWTAKGNAFFTGGAFEEAVEAFNKAIQLDPNYGVPYGNLALTYLTQGQFAEAILLYQKSIELLDSAKDKALSWNGLGNAYRCTGDYNNAVAAYQKAAELDPETNGIRDRADDFEPVTTPRTASAWNELGELLLKTGAIEKAADAFRAAIELEPESGRAHYNLARTLAAQGQYKEAVPEFEKSIEMLEDNKEKADAWNGLGNAYRKMNDYDRAIRAYQKAVVLADEGVDLLTRARFSLLSNCYVNQ